ncbi:MAG: hypothetical protein J5582_15550 [Ruminococcus sp.]|uniref:hypothetical protein n=1 Tax=Ruminococcus sp. TaxID=41978 RepID=UPI0025E66A5E|nr:hypothetical protein [Ruminococcus sp.]MBO4867955.1 hypothetical protein [Ruminococcus sp.]
MANKDIRVALKIADIPYWRVAEELGVSENTILRRMRTELTAEDRIKFLAAIDNIKKENEED